MPDQFTTAVKEYLRAKIEQRAPEVTIEKEGKPAPQVINIMDALKKSIQAKGRTKVRAVVGKHIGQAAPKQVTPRSPRPKPKQRTKSRHTGGNSWRLYRETCRVKSPRGEQRTLA